MYTEFLQDQTPSWRRVRVSLTSVGRSLKRIELAKIFITLGLIFIVAISMVTAQINLKTAETNYGNHIADVRSSAVQGWKLSIAKYK